jgi:branched-chain amino acid transport system ATP-binding protein
VSGAGYGEAIVLRTSRFALEEGDSLALLGRNGMGKTTLLATLMGATRQRAARSVRRADIARRARPPPRRAGHRLGAAGARHLRRR